MRVLRGVAYMTKSSGPRTEPWGTPQGEVYQEDRSVSHLIRKHVTLPNFIEIGQTVAEIWRFNGGGRRHLGFTKIRNFNGLSPVGSQSASPCPKSSKSVKRLPRYGDLTVFKMAAVRHLAVTPPPSFCTSGSCISPDDLQIEPDAFVSRSRKR